MYYIQYPFVIFICADSAMFKMCINPLPDEQRFCAVEFLYILMHKINQICHFSSLSIFCLGCKAISRRAARRLIVLHPKQNIESEPK